MRRVVAAVVVMSLPARAAPAQAPPPARSGPTWADAGWVAAAGVLYVLPGALGLPQGAPSCAPCDPATLPGFDRWAVRPVVHAAAVASSAALLGVAGWTALAGLQGLPADRWRDNVARFAEATSWTAASTEWLKVLVRRKRPVLYTSDAVAAAADRDNQKSLPSGHTSLAFSAATAYLVISRREHLPHRTRNALLLYAGAVAVGALRVAAAQHFPSDVATGAVLGVGVGWLVPTIHPTTP